MKHLVILSFIISMTSFAGSSIKLISECSKYSHNFCIDKCVENQCSANSVGIQEDTTKTFNIEVVNTEPKASILEVTNNCNFLNTYFINNGKSERVYLIEEPFMTLPILLEAKTGDEECVITLRLLNNKNVPLYVTQINALVWY